LEKKLIEQQAEKINCSYLKHIIDIVFASLFLVLVFSWLYPLLAIIIKIDSKGPALFVQDRVGLNGKIFKFYKLRTLKNNEPSSYKESILTSETINVTSFGSFLRKLNLDEIPQFINVFLGDMSIVGPRPHAIPFHEAYATYINNISERLLTKPGITGLAQVKGFRGDVPDAELNKIRTTRRVELDIEYIKTWSLQKDINIMFTTMLQMLGLTKKL